MTAIFAWRRLMKVLHTVAAGGFMGGLAALAIVAALAPASVGAPGLAPFTAALAQLCTWLIGPAMVATVVSGLLAMLANPAFYEALWVWAKAATGILILEGGLHVMGPIQDNAKRAAAALAASPDAANAASLLTAEINTAWVLVAVSVFNVALGVWRPRLRLGLD